jgi:hypothetical protein
MGFLYVCINTSIVDDDNFVDDGKESENKQEGEWRKAIKWERDSESEKENPIPMKDGLQSLEDNFSIIISVFQWSENSAELDVIFISTPPSMKAWLFWILIEAGIITINWFLIHTHLKLHPSV